MKKIAALFIVLVCLTQLGIARSNNSFQSHQKKSHTIFKQWLPQFHKGHKFEWPVIVYGPKEFERSKGTPKTEVDTFSLKGNSTAPYTMVVTNAFCNDKEVTSATIKLNGVQIFGPSDFKKNKPLLIKTVTLSQTNTITVKIAGKRGTHLLVTILGKRSQQTDTTPPVLAVSAPSDGTITNDSTIIVSGTATDQSAVSVTINGEEAVVGAGGEFAEEIALTEGINTISVVATDASNNASTVTRTITKDTTPPQLTVDNGQLTITNQPSITISGTVSDLTATMVTINGSSVPVSNGAFSVSVPLTEGLNEIAVVATDAAGNSLTETRTVRKDALPPVVVVSGTTDGMITNQSSVQISGSANDSTAVTVTVNGTSVPVEGGTFTYTAPLVEGSNTITIVATDGAGNSTTITRIVIKDATPPLLTVNSPLEGIVVSSQTSEVSGTVSDSTAVIITVNGDTVTVIGGAFSQSVTLSEGTNTITITAIDEAGNGVSESRKVRLDTQPPMLTINTQQIEITTQLSVIISGTVSDSSTAAIDINGTYLTVEADGSFSYEVFLVEGTNVFVVTAEDALGNNTSITVLIIKDTAPPVLTIESPQEGGVTGDQLFAVTGTINDSTAVSVTVNGITAQVIGGSFNISVPLIKGENTIIIVATDAVGNSTTVTRVIRLLTSDPAAVAPPIDLTVPTTMARSVSFLYTGPDPIQTGVDSGTINPVQVGVLRGKVSTREGEPLPDVQISILDHPEFGQTLTRVDGWFDMAVNAGSYLTVMYTKEGYLSAARQVPVQWQHFAVVDSVVLIQLDTHSTVIDFSEPIQIARGSVVTDDDGPRQATMMFAQGTQTMMKKINYSYQTVYECGVPRQIKVAADTITQVLNSLTVRATEYTVGANGPQAMPVALPPTSAYTYCVELSADEALAANASAVTFSKPVIFYQDNFLEIPVGTTVPVGYYDRERGVWVASEDGRVIEITSTSGGVAEIDNTGDGIPEPQDTLLANGFSPEELSSLAQLYSAGKTLWRAGLSHFSPVDLNYPAKPEDGSKPPKVPSPKKGDGSEDDGDGDGDGDDNNNDEEGDDDGGSDGEDDTGCGSIIRIQDQSLGQVIPVPGTSFSLNYVSSRSKGDNRAFSLTVPVSGDTIPSNVKRMDVTIGIAGRTFSQSFSPAPNITYNFVWDGKDAYDRIMQGAQPYTVTISYLYDGYYTLPASARSSFGMPSDTGSFIIKGRDLAPLSKVFTGVLGTYQSQPLGLGGWGLNVHQFYNPGDRTLFHGNGNKRRSKLIGRNITTVAGTEGSGPDRLVAGPDGTLYFISYDLYQVYKRDLCGTVTLVAGNGEDGDAGDGGMATDAQLGDMAGLALGADGSLYIVQGYYARIRRVGTDGIITTVAGNGTSGTEGDDVLATEAQLSYPWGIAVAPDGSFYIADDFWIRRVGTDGIITTIAGERSIDGMGYSGDGGPAKQAKFYYPAGMCLAADGSLLIAEAGNNVIRKIDPSGIITTIAGTGDWGFSGDGGPATEALLDTPVDVVMAPDGTIYFSDNGNSRVRAIGVNGVISTYAGSDNDDTETGGDNGPALRASFSNGIRGLALAPDGTIYVSDQGIGFAGLVGGFPLEPERRIRKIEPTLPGFSPTEYVIPSEDGSELFVFDADGRHTRTLDALQGFTVSQFEYNVAGILIAVKDKNELVTTIERDSNGNMTSIISPYGQRTYFIMDTLGNITEVIDPAGDTTHYTYTPTGLMTSLKDPNGNVHRFTYNSLGYLIKDEDPAGGYKQLSRVNHKDGFTVTIATAMGEKTKYRVQRRSNGNVVHLNTDANGLQTRTIFGANGITIITDPDGTITQITKGPDPRFGMQAPIILQSIITMPSGLQSITNHSRTITELAGLKVVGLTDEIYVNDRYYQRIWDGNQNLFTTISPEGRQTYSFVDSVGRTMKDSVPGLYATNYKYDSKGGVTDVVQGERHWHFEYDLRGKLASAADPLQHATSFVYDSVGRTTLQTLPDNNTVVYRYDANGNLLGLTPPGKPEHAFDFTVTNLTNRYIPPVAEMDTTITRYAYDLDKRITHTHLPSGASIVIAYDSSGCGCSGTSTRLRSISYDRGMQTFAYYTPTGQMSRNVTPEGDSLLYNFDGVLPTSVTWQGSINSSVGVVYDNSFRVTEQTINGGNSVSFEYDNDVLLTKVGNMTLTYDPTNGLPTGTSLGNITTSQTYNEYGEMTSYQTKYGESSLFSTSYIRDSIGRITTVDETIQNVGKIRRYAYDNLGRLKKVWRNDTLVSQYSYDANGNRLVHWTPTATDSGSYDGQDRLLNYSSTRYLYTAAGELSIKIEGVDTSYYTYDNFGNLTKVILPSDDVIEYIVDGQSRRIATKFNGNIVRRWIYSDQLSPVAELDSAGNVVALFVGGYMVKGDNIYRFLTDQLGSIRLVVNVNTGIVVQRIDYDEFGNVTYDSNPDFQPFAYAGGLYDSHTKLIRFGARDYDASVGRWTTKDPVGFKGGLNSFLYVDQDPVSYIDPSGLGKVGFCIKTAKGIWKAVNRSTAAKKLAKNKDVLVRGRGASGDAKKLAREKFGDKTVRHDPHEQGQYPHYQHKNGGKGHVLYESLNGLTAVGVFGSNILTEAIDFFNPISDARDVVELFLDEEGEESDQEPEACKCK